ncbi:MAG: hypothetical protein M1832_004217 [Thelocarpon impressellum]|nr:MAG: hypothetical protein M1832_004217 [Thelocarpon impressellum]
MRALRRPQRPLLLVPLLLPSTTLALSLASFQTINSSNKACLAAYNSEIPSCSASDFSNGAACSTECVVGLGRVQDRVEQACKGVQGPKNSLLGDILNGAMIVALCPNVMTTVTLVGTQTVSTKPTGSSRASATTTTSSTASSSTTSSSDSTASTSSTSDSTATDRPLQTQPTLTPTPSDQSTTLATTTLPLTPPVTEAPPATDVPASSPPVPTRSAPPPSGQGGGGGGGSPFDVGTNPALANAAPASLRRPRAASTLLAAAGLAVVLLAASCS